MFLCKHGRVVVLVYHVYQQGGVHVSSHHVSRPHSQVKELALLKVEDDGAGDDTRVRVDDEVVALVTCDNLVGDRRAAGGVHGGDMSSFRSVLYQLSCVLIVLKLRGSIVRHSHLKIKIYGYYLYIQL